LKRTKTNLIFIVIFASSLLSGCNHGKEENNNRRQFPDSLLQEGDIVFRRGSGLASRAILSTDRRGVYSHIGIIVKDKGIWKVVHAVPGEPDFKGDPDRIKMETIEIFFSKQRAICGAIMRVKNEPLKSKNAAKEAIRLLKKRVLFDHDYNLEDSTKMYCTELVYFVYKKERIDLSKGEYSKINIPGFNERYLLPGDIQQSDKLNSIFHFE